jgi:hypothetical protein
MEALYPNFVSSNNAEGLLNLMAQVSLRRGGTVLFFSVYFDGKNHVACYHDKLENIAAQEYNALKDKSDAGRNKA